MYKRQSLVSARDPKRYHDESKQFIQQAASANVPFFLMANIHDPHRPFASSDGSRRRLEKEEFPESSRHYTADQIPVPGFLPDLPEVRREIAQYYTSVKRADDSVGAILDAIEQSGTRNHTVVFFMSDHGMALPFAKTNCWRHSTRTPWIVRWPGIVHKGSIDRKHMISGIDVAPTILEITRTAQLPALDGRSIVSILKGETQTNRDHVVTQINRTAGKRAYPMRAIQTKTYGYIFNTWPDGETVFRNESQSGLTMKAMKKAAVTDRAIASRVRHFLYRSREEFYDYSRDPDALNNLISKPEYQATIADLKVTLRKYMKDTNDPLLSEFAVEKK